MLIAPLLSRIMQKATKRQYQAVLAVGFVACFQLLGGRWLMSQQQILLFVYLYLVGGYIRRYHAMPATRRWPVVAAYAIILAVMFAYTLWKNCQTAAPASHAFRVYAMEYHGLVLPLSVAFFLWVKDWRLPSAIAKVAVAIAPLSFAVYIIHTQPNVHHLLWQGVSQLLTHVHPWALPPLILLISAAVFLVGIAIEKVRVTVSHYLWSVIRPKSSIG